MELFSYRFFCTGWAGICIPAAQGGVVLICEVLSRVTFGLPYDVSVPIFRDRRKM